MLKTQKTKLARVGLLALMVVTMLTPLAYSFPIFGTLGQLGVTEYPEAWHNVNEYLNKDKKDFNVLFLPWHQYMDFNWLPNREKRLGNPARMFFDKPLIQGDNVEMPGLYSQSTNQVSKYIEFLLSKGDSVDNLGELLAPLNVKYVILVSDADYKAYDFLYRQIDLKIVLQKPGITLIINEHPVARAYAVDDVVHINSLEEYVQYSKTQDVMEHLYVFMNAPGEEGLSAPMEELSSVKMKEIQYLVSGTSDKYTIFALPQNVNMASWRYNDEKPSLLNLGFMPAFTSATAGGDIIYTLFYQVYLPGYIFSALALVFMVYYYTRYSHEKHTIDT